LVLTPVDERSTALHKGARWSSGPRADRDRTGRSADQQDPLPQRVAGDPEERLELLEPMARVRPTCTRSARSRWRSRPTAGDTPHPTLAAAVGGERAEGGHHPVPGLRRSLAVARPQKRPEVVPGDVGHLDVGPEIRNQGSQDELVDPAGAKPHGAAQGGLHRRPDVPASAALLAAMRCSTDSVRPPRAPKAEQSRCAVTPKGGSALPFRGCVATVHPGIAPPQRPTLSHSLEDGCF
jgi:hypothetical protein